MKTYPQTYQKGDFVFFLHIPKTAGTSLTDALTAGFDSNTVITPQQMNNVRKHPTEIFERAELLCGHFNLQMCERRLPKQPNFVLTFLRDPTEHFVSLFFHLRVDSNFTYSTRLTKDKALSEEVHRRAVESSLDEFLALEQSRLFDNFQTRYLVQGLSADHAALADPEQLPVARNCLQQLPFFGLTERYAESLQLLQGVMGETFKMRVKRINRARNKPRDFTLSPDTLAAIEQRTAVDRQLLQFASEEFERRLANQA